MKKLIGVVNPDGAAVIREPSDPVFTGKKLSEGDRVEIIVTHPGSVAEGATHGLASWGELQGDVGWVNLTDLTLSEEG